MRVAQVIETMNMGGAEKLTVNVANELADRGDESHLIVTSHPGPLSEHISDKVFVHYLDFNRASISNPLKFFASIRRGRTLLANVVIENSIEVIQTHLPGSNFLGLMLARNKTCAVLVTIHNNNEFRYGIHDSRILVALRKRAYRSMIDRCQGMIAVSDAVRESMIEELGSSRVDPTGIQVVTNAVPIPDSIKDVKRQLIRSDFGLVDGKLGILAAGRFCEQKNHQDLVKVAANLVQLGVSFRILIAGDGELRESVEAAIRKANLESEVVCVGNLQNLGEAMQSVDIFAMTSLWEGLPLVLLEAMASGLPAIAYAIDGINEVIVEGESGVTVPVGDTDAMASAIACFAKEKDMRLAFGTAGQNVIAEMYSFSKFVDELFNFYSLGLDKFRSTH